MVVGGKVKSLSQKYFGENIFGNNIFFGKGLHFPSHPMLSTPHIQLPPLLFEVEGGTKQTKDELTDWTEHR